jgi:prepilin-type N-terminal cleavage/methylation domain-containing protein
MTQWIANTNFRQKGFTLIELMIVVVILAVLVGVAVVAYTKHIKSSRLIAERAFVSEIISLQETYFQQTGYYFDVSGGAGAVGTPYPAQVAGKEPVAKDWNPSGAGVNGWVTLGAAPQGNVTYMTWQVEAGLHLRNNNLWSYALYGEASLPSSTDPTGIPDQPATARYPWYYIKAWGNLDGRDGDCITSNTGPVANCTNLYASSARETIATLNEGQ